MTDPKPRVLIVFASRRGGTAGLVDMIGDALEAAGCSVITSPADGVADFFGVDAVIVAGSLYYNRWHRHASRFVRRNAAVLRTLPVWLVCSGPLDDSATQREIAPTRQLTRLAALVDARGQVTFGGRLQPDARGVLAHAMAKTRAGDWRDAEHVTSFVASVCEQLRRS